MEHCEDTIAAISTPPGESGIGVVRLSGPRSLDIAGAMFRSPRGNVRLRHSRIHYGRAVDAESGDVIDEVLVLVMKSPHSYTREDVVEIQCHGGALALTGILESSIRLGARLAGPGEFTRRAFMNGRIDLLQAEAVIEVIRSRSEKALHLASRQLGGKVSEELAAIRKRVVELLASIEAPLDFPDEEIATPSDRELLSSLGGLCDDIGKVIERTEASRVYREGLRCAIVGKPNVGKSSLLNALVGHERAIVTEFPGTTRDSIECWMSIRGIPVTLLDTAGLRNTGDPIEREGVRKTEEALLTSDCALLVIDLTTGVTDEDEEILQMLKEGKLKVLYVINKCDVAMHKEPKGVLSLIAREGAVSVSAMTGVGIDLLKEALGDRLSQQGERGDGCALCSTRHLEVLMRAREALMEAQLAIQEGYPHDACLVELKRAHYSFGELFGEDYSVEVLDALFSEFCIGK